MIFEPEPGTSINLNGESIEFVALEAAGPAAVFVYAESGREGTVYKVRKGEEFYALKVFYPQYRNKRLLENTKKLSRFKNLEGFRVAERMIINRQRFPDVVADYPDLNYSVLMPWIQGTVWGNLMVQYEHSLSHENYFQIAQTLTRVVHNLETQGLAHCDLSNNNFIIDQTLSSIQLVDIEDMYASDMPRPIPDISYGTIGYRTKWIAQDGLWGPEADRFASAILCAEILTWHNPEIRENRAGDTAFFDEAEIGENSQRYKLMIRYLGAVGKDLQLLFKRAWFSEGFDQCPPVLEWTKALVNIDIPTAPAQEENELPSEKKLIKGRNKTTRRNDHTIVNNIPPKMEISHSILDFGILQNSDTTLEFAIVNKGGSVLTGKVDSVSWVEVSPSRFLILPGDSQSVIV
jgi:serine/threonine protein kinase